MNIFRKRRSNYKRFNVGPEWGMKKDKIPIPSTENEQISVHILIRFIHIMIFRF